jgi:hypothetical protein
MVNPIALTRERACRRRECVAKQTKSRVRKATKGWYPIALTEEFACLSLFI